MGEATGIEWTSHTWNPWKGCTKISPGCKNCYMFTEQARYGSDPATVQRTKTWGMPVRWNRKAAAAGRKELVFTCSWSDWFHEAADEWRDEAWRVIKSCPNLIFQILTKRHEEMESRLPKDWGDGCYPNVWLGVSVESQGYADLRIPFLRALPAAVRFLSVEPLLGPVDLQWLLDGIGWVIVGGESDEDGKSARPMHPEWARDVRDECQEAGVPFFFKQQGCFECVREFGQLETWVCKARTWVLPDDVCLDTAGRVLKIGADFQRARDEGTFPVALMRPVGKKRAGRLLDGREWNEMPIGRAELVE